MVVFNASYGEFAWPLAQPDSPRSFREIELAWPSLMLGHLTICIEIQTNHLLHLSKVLESECVS